MPSRGPSDLDLERLTSLATARDDVAPVVLRVQADLFAAARRRDDSEAASFAELAVALLPRVDADTAAHVARRVAALPETPLSVAASLAACGGEAGRLVAALSPHAGALVRDSALENALDSPLATLARARRADLDPPEIERLAALADPAIDRALADNPRAILQGRVRETLVARARTEERLADALLARSDLEPEDAAALYPHAEPPRRAAILARLAATPRPSGAATVLPRPPLDVATALVGAAERSDRAAFGSQLALALGLDSVPDWRFDEPARHDLLAFALLAAGLSEEAAIRIFLTLDPRIARSVETVFGLVARLRATPRSVAARVVSCVYDVALASHRRGTRHVPVLAPDERRRATPATSGALAFVDRAARRERG